MILLATEIHTPWGVAEWTAIATLFVAILGTTWRLSISSEKRSTIIEQKLDTCIQDVSEIKSSSEEHAKDCNHERTENATLLKTHHKRINRLEERWETP